MTARLSDYGETLTIRQVCEVMQISERKYRFLRQHHAWKIPHIDGFPNRFSNEVVARFIHSGESARLRRVS